MTKLTVTGLAVCFVVIASSAGAFVVGGTNFGFGGYPDHRCHQPYASKPYRPFRFESQYEVDAYNRRVEEYNAQVDEYFDCIETYVDNAKNDIRRIREKANDAITEANLF